MPPRPSRNLDRALLSAGRALFPGRGCAGLSVREVADAAGVNLGMFHYHFKTREAFLRALLQSVYEDMYTELAQRAARSAPGGPAASALEVLRAALQFMGRFVRDNRPVLARILADALCNDPIAGEFLERNAPRHLGLMLQLVEAGQRDGSVRADVAAPQLLGFCAGSLATPILFGGAVAERRPGTPQARGLEATLFSDAAIDQRIELAIAVLADPTALARPRARVQTRKGRP